MQVDVPIEVASAVVVPLSLLPQAFQAQNISEPIFLGPCLCNVRSNGISIEEWTEWMENTNKMPKRNTSKYRRKLTSAGDERLSSKSIGIVAICVLISVAVIILVMDAPKVVYHIFKGCLKKRNSDNRKKEH